MCKELKKSADNWGWWGIPQARSPGHRVRGWILPSALRKALPPTRVCGFLCRFAPSPERALAFFQASFGLLGSRWPASLLLTRRPLPQPKSMPRLTAINSGSW